MHCRVSDRALPALPSPQYRLLAMDCGTLFYQSGACTFSQQSCPKILCGLQFAEVSDDSAVSLKAVRLLLEQWVDKNLESQRKLIRQLVEQVVEMRSSRSSAKCSSPCNVAH